MIASEGYLSLRGFEGRGTSVRGAGEGRSTGVEADAGDKEAVEVEAVAVFHPPGVD